MVRPGRNGSNFYIFRNTYQHREELVAAVVVSCCTVHSAVTHLASGIEAPSVDLAVLIQCHDEPMAGGNIHNILQIPVTAHTPDLNRPILVSIGSGKSIAQLAMGIVTPDPNSTVGLQGNGKTCVVVAGSISHLGCGNPGTGFINDRHYLHTKNTGGVGGNMTDKDRSGTKRCSVNLRSLYTQCTINLLHCHNIGIAGEDLKFIEGSVQNSIIAGIMRILTLCAISFHISVKPRHQEPLDLINVNN